MKKTSPNSSSKDNDFSAAALAQEQYLYLTTHGRASGLPREIEIWFTRRDGRFYVIAEYPTSHWVHNLRAHSGAKRTISVPRMPIAGPSFVDLRALCG